MISAPFVSVVVGISVEKCVFPFVVEVGTRGGRPTDTRRAETQSRTRRLCGELSGGLLVGTIATKKGEIN